MKSWRWIGLDVALSIHAEQIAEHGGAAGVRDQGLLESALARPKNVAAYTDPSVFDLAAAYAVAIAGNHPFVDGNKRTAYVAMELFLDLHGWVLVASDAESATTMLAVAAGDLDETKLASWLKANARRNRRR